MSGLKNQDNRWFAKVDVSEQELKKYDADEGHRDRFFDPNSPLQYSKGQRTCPYDPLRIYLSILKEHKFSTLILKIFFGQLNLAEKILSFLIPHMTASSVHMLRKTLQRKIRNVLQVI
jgi:hypothetical protein